MTASWLVDELGRAYEQLQVMRPENVEARLAAQGFIIPGRVDALEDPA